MGVFASRSKNGAADALRPLLYGDRAMNLWPEGVEHDGVEPWASFVAARDLARAGSDAEARAIWMRLAEWSELESRHTLQAWHFLRASGIAPPSEVACNVLATVAEVAVGQGHDLLIAYSDGAVRYLNHSGKAAVVEATGTTPGISATTSEWLEIARVLANVIGTWDEPALPPLPTGHTRIMMLTPAGSRFGQGPDAKLRLDAPAGAYLAAATKVLQTVAYLA